MTGIEVRMAVLSHLSDAQELGDIAAGTIIARERSNLIQAQNRHIKFAKCLLIRYKENLNQEVSDEELDELWNEIFK